MNAFKVLNKNQTASFDIDCQYTFTPVCPDELPVKGALDIVDELNQQAAMSLYRLGSKDAHSPHAIWIADENNPSLSAIEGEHVDLRWPAHAIVGTKGFELIEGLPRVTDYDFFVWKGIEPHMHPYGTCYHDLTKKMSTGVIEFLTVRHVTTVIVGGLATDYCVKNTVLELLTAGFNVIVNLGACRGISQETINAAIDEMKQKGAIIINSVKELAQ